MQTTKFVFEDSYTYIVESCANCKVNNSDYCCFINIEFLVLTQNFQDLLLLLVM